MESRIETLAENLRATGLKLVTVESCTGGLVAASCTDLAGSSDWFEAGLVTYSNQAKQSLVKVDEALLAQYGAVSEPVAIAMAQGALSHFPQAISLSITGIAGPGGATKTKPLGLVYIAVSQGDRYRVKECHFKGNRQEVRLQSRDQAIEMLVHWIKEQNC